mmetsp:Transcript_149229/g.275394  ORF Transcript_149229/g.275394 Transcript_149229/m.275394 type:complete len:250 (+) Transcript_149229:61-810(+)
MLACRRGRHEAPVRGVLADTLRRPLGRLRHLLRRRQRHCLRRPEDLLGSASQHLPPATVPARPLHQRGCLGCCLHWAPATALSHVQAQCLRLLRVEDAAPQQTALQQRSVATPSAGAAAGAAQQPRSQGPAQRVVAAPLSEDLQQVRVLKPLGVQRQLLVWKKWTCARLLRLSAGSTSSADSSRLRMPRFRALPLILQLWMLDTIHKRRGTSRMTPMFCRDPALGRRKCRAWRSSACRCSGSGRPTLAV